MITFESHIFDEPELEFGDRHHHPDPRLGLFEAGPLQPFVGEVIRIGVVGSAKTIEDTRKFLAAATGGVEGFSDKHPNVRAVFMLVGTKDERNFHLRALAAIAQIVQDPVFERKWQAARSEQALRDVVLLGTRHREHPAK